MSFTTVLISKNFSQLSVRYTFIFIQFSMNIETVLYTERFSVRPRSESTSNDEVQTCEKLSDIVSGHRPAGGLKWIRTTDLMLIRHAL